MAETESLEMDEILEKITFYSIDQARAKLEAGEECAPFTVIVEGDQMFEENYPDEDPATCRANAEANVKSASTFSSHYTFCYDGFLETDKGTLDAIIVECAQCDMEQAYVIGLLYKSADDGLVFEDQPAYLDSVESFYDAAAVAAAHEEALSDAAEQDEMDAAQAAIDKTLSLNDDAAEQPEAE